MSKHKHQLLSHEHHKCACSVADRRKSDSVFNLVDADLHIKHLGMMHNLWLTVKCDNCGNLYLTGKPFAVTSSNNTISDLYVMAKTTLEGWFCLDNVSNMESARESICKAKRKLEEIRINHETTNGDITQTIIVLVNGKLSAHLDKEKAHSIFIAGAERFFSGFGLTEAEIDKLFPISTIEEALRLSAFLIESKKFYDYQLLTSTTTYTPTFSYGEE